MKLPIYQVDAFANQAFVGNPAGVCVLEEVLEDSVMQNIALEMNLAETAFVIREQANFRLRWFTPMVEVDLCGHATLATSHILWETGVLKPDESGVFETRSGQLTATRIDESIQLDFPSQPPEQCETPRGLLEALGIKDCSFVGQNKSDYILEVENESVLRGIEPDLDGLRRVECRGVIVTTKSSTEQYDFVSRFFAPAVGVDEDPVTGSAHCCLTPYWANRLGKDVMNAYQASKRGGELTVQLLGERVQLRGKAVTVIEGNLMI
jgi:PhzF family phenazine biosynthesis protein